MKTRTFLKAMALPFAYQATRSFAQGAGRPIRMVVPVPAGSFSDFVARLISRAASPILGQPIVIDNKPGANGIIGVLDVARAAPDGLTLLCGSSSNLGANVAMVKNLPYDPRRDFTPIAGGNVTAQMLVVKANSPIRTLADFIAQAKKNPGKLSCGYATGVTQLQFATLGKMAGIDLLLVPYKGAPAAVADVIGGVLDAAIDAPALSLPQVSAGNLRAIATTAKRSLNPLFPDVPEVAETLPGYDFPGWNAFVGPAGMPHELVNRLSAAFTQAQRQPHVQQQLRIAGAPVNIITPDQLKADIEAEVTRYVTLAKQAGIQPT